MLIYIYLWHNWRDVGIALLWGRTNNPVNQPGEQTRLLTFWLGAEALSEKDL